MVVFKGPQLSEGKASTTQPMVTYWPWGPAGSVLEAGQASQVPPGPIVPSSSQVPGSPLGMGQVPPHGG